ncbi:hypothetical protein K2173_006846 [Erythroxylum novogranatense]|uniref:DDHD domain-containing protein n=1 Tax=Erythroxylum novogranatense TaxID=1862640 RepID=A0AAV8SXX5_9ROSI|nr:hypothetical protein K2173_006846 [Erythroxylum novogranatense]
MAHSEANQVVSEETSPDLLKNTPNNIARLVDAIEQCKGRQKYLAQTSSPSDGSDIRWYFCKVPLAEKELAASIPRTEVVGKGEYFRFGMRDSLAIEAAFLQKEEELLSTWWREYAECSEGPKGRPLDKGKNAQECVEPSQLYEEEEERVGVPVKGGLYEVDLVRRHCFPVYWHGENRRVLRGHWFARKGGLDWLPVREDVAEQLEIAFRRQVWHRRTFQPSGLFAARVDLQGSTPGLHALFTGEDHTWEAWLNADTLSFSGVINLSGAGVKLRRGYSASQSTKPTQDELRQQKEEEMDDYCSQVPVRHVVFMVHGIGQRLEKSNLVDDVGDFRHITSNLAERHLTSQQRSAQRVLFIPCQWRKGLKLSGETAVDKCTLDGVRGLRIMLSATVHDVLYYMSPIYCQSIIDSVSNQLNCLYLKFLKRNPGYDGKVSIYGHSLGSVLSYDILCHQGDLSSPFPMDSIHKESTKNAESSLYVNNQILTYDSSINCVEDNKSTDRSNFIDEGSAQSTVVNEDGLGNTSASVSPVASDSNMMTIMPENTEQGRIKDDVREEINVSNDATSEKRDNITGLEKREVEDCKDINGKDKLITSLGEEIEILRARIQELESYCSGRDAIGGLCRENGKAGVSIPEEHTSEKMPPDHNAPKSYTPYIKYTKLEFNVDTFYAVGSPLGVFLALRNIRLGIGRGKDYWEEENITEEMPCCRQMFNIFHPYDPVAYRVEPLVCKEYIDKRPVIVPYHRGGRRLHIGFQEFTEELAARSQAMMKNFNSVKVKVLTVCHSRSMDSTLDAENIQENEGRTYGSLMMEMLTGSEDGRIDYMLQDKTFEHPYLQAIGSHTNYWRDYDTALFILKHLYRDIPEEGFSPENFNDRNLKHESNSRRWSDQRDTLEEELPLTFSDRMMSKSFSRKARKFMKTT